MNYKEVYKIVRYNSDNKLFSYNTTNKYCLEYELNKWTYPKIGKIFTFESLEDAIHHKENFKLFKAKTTNWYFQNKIIKPHIPTSAFQEYLYFAFWNNIEEIDSEAITPILSSYTVSDFVSEQLLVGTVMCDNLMLTEEII